MSVKRILISGGWGYGNLGDDAILHATVRLVANYFHDSEIILFSYSPENTTAELDNKYKVYPSAHRLLFGKSAFRQLNIYGKSIDNRSLAGRIKNRIKSYLPSREIQADSHALSSIAHLFDSADIFIMAGGGYFNNWRESLLARCEELRLAYDHGVRSYIIGQTLDKFNNLYLDTVKSRLEYCTNIAVRDNDSLNIIEEMGLKGHIIPDLALSLTSQEKAINPDKFVFIPAELPPRNEMNIIRGVKDFAKDKGLTVHVAMTRLYNGDVRCARKVVAELKKHGVPVAFSIPQSYTDIRNAIMGAKLIFSRNLHGLILGYVGGGNVVSLNDQWKFKGFLNQINADKALINADTASPQEIAAELNDAWENDLSDLVRLNLKKEVEENFKNLF